MGKLLLSYVTSIIDMPIKSGITGNTMKAFVIYIGLVLFLCGGCSNHKNEVMASDPNSPIKSLIETCENPALQKSLSSNEIRYLHSSCEMLAELSGTHAIQIDFYTYADMQGKKNMLQSGSIWFCKGDLFIQRSPDPNSGELENLNYATIDGKVFEWNSITKKGRTYKRYDRDTFEFLIYFVDAAGFKTFTYEDYIQKPEQFKVTVQQNIKTIELLEPRYGFEGIQIIEKPFWLYALILRHSPDSPRIFYVFEQPKPINMVPKHLKKLPYSIDFQESDLTLEARMEYL
jgi:hypothetical protein